MDFKWIKSTGVCSIDGIIGTIGVKVQPTPVSNGVTVDEPTGAAVVVAMLTKL